MGFKKLLIHLTTCNLKIFVIILFSNSALFGYKSKTPELLFKMPTKIPSQHTNWSQFFIFSKFS